MRPRYVSRDVSWQKIGIEYNIKSTKLLYLLKLQQLANWYVQRSTNMVGLIEQFCEILFYFEF